MRAIIQRSKALTKIVSRSGDIVESHEFEGPGLVALVGWLETDSELGLAELQKKEEWLRTRIQGLRVFPDSQGRMNLNLSDYLKQNNLSGGGILWVSQFTLAAELSSGFRPSFTPAMTSAAALQRFEEFRNKINNEPQSYKNIFGIFGADMDISFTNWGPVTIPLQS